MNAPLSPAQNERLESAVAEFFEALERCATPDRADLLSRYHDVADELASFFDDHDRLASYVATPPITPLAGSDTTVSGTAITLDRASAGGSFAHPPTANQLPATYRMGPYELLQEIGRGGMGVVYKARHVELNRVVALKTILDASFATSEDRNRFAAEARAAAHLDHIGIVPIFEVGAGATVPYLAMQFVEGDSLANCLRAGPLEPRQAARMLRKIAAAVAHAHARGIIHRDLKPGNILLTRSDPTKSEPESSDTLPVASDALEPRITDFGLAKRLDDSAQLTTSGQILGTPGYMPPEQASGRVHEIGAAADIYALGAILYAMLTSQPPFRSENPVEVILQVLEREPTLPRKLNPAVPRELEWICLRCLEKKPADRYATAAELATDLDRFLCHEPPHARRLSPVSRLRRWVRRQPVLAGHLLALILPFLIIQGVLITTPGRDLVHHTQLSGLLLVWMLSSCICQWLMDRQRSSRWPLYLWSAADTAFLTGLLCLIPPPLGVLTCGYLLLICVSALAGVIRLVSFTTVCSMLGYIGLSLLRPDDTPPLSYATTLLTIFALTGMTAGYQVWRLRVLHEFWGDRQVQ